MTSEFWICYQSSFGANSHSLQRCQLRGHPVKISSDQEGAVEIQPAPLPARPLPLLYMAG